MAVTTQDYIAKLLSAYENATGEKNFKIAGDMDIPISNYYLYRNGIGNPTAKTINKIMAVIQINHPDVIIESTAWSLRQWIKSAAADAEEALVLF